MLKKDHQIFKLMEKIYVNDRNEDMASKGNPKSQSNIKCDYETA